MSYLELQQDPCGICAGCQSRTLNLKCGINMTTVTLATEFIYTFVGLRRSGEAVRSAVHQMGTLGNTRKLCALSVALLLVDLLYSYRSIFM